MTPIALPVRPLLAAALACAVAVGAAAQNVDRVGGSTEAQMRDPATMPMMSAAPPPPTPVAAAPAAASAEALPRCSARVTDHCTQGAPMPAKRRPR